MDDEDLADWHADRPLQVTEAYGGASVPPPADPLLAALVAPTSSLSASADVHRGQQLLQKMGWKPGQGIGPLVSHARRTQLAQQLAQMHLGPLEIPSDAPPNAQTLRCPPPDTQASALPVSTNHHGLGFVGESRSQALQDALSRFHAPQVGAAGLDSDDEDHVYASAPSIHESTLARPPTETLMLKEESTSAPAASTKDTWQDGRPLPPGFVRAPDVLVPERVWPAPPVASDWRPDPRRVWDACNVVETPRRPTSAADRGALLGEAPHPGPPPAISQFLQAKAQARQAADTGPTQALTVHRIDAETARRALAAFRSTGAEPAKEARYRAYLQCFEQGTAYTPNTSGMPGREAQQELDEFFEMASRHRPVHGDMAARFTAGTTVQESLPVAGGLQSAEALRAAAAEAKPHAAPQVPAVLTPAQVAARNGEFGTRTRSVVPLHPPRLLCKRLGVPIPHVQGAATADDIDAPTEPAMPAPDEAPSSEYVFTEPSEEQALAWEHALQEERPPRDLFKAVFESDEEGETQASTDVLRATLPKRKASAPSKKKKVPRTGPLTFDIE